jgi:hypothetical protein
LIGSAFARRTNHCSAAVHGHCGAQTAVAPLKAARRFVLLLAMNRHWVPDPAFRPTPTFKACQPPVMGSTYKAAMMLPPGQLTGARYAYLSRYLSVQRHTTSISLLSTQVRGSNLHSGATARGTHPASGLCWVLQHPTSNFARATSLCSYWESLRCQR